MEIRIPEVGESIREALLAKWFKKTGDQVHKDEPLCEIETDKITLDIHADASGTLSVQVAEGTTVPIGAIVGSIVESSVTRDVPVSPPQGALNRAISAAPAAEEVTSPVVRREMRERGLAPGSVTGTGKGGRVTLDDLFSHNKPAVTAVPPVPPQPAAVPPAAPAVPPAPPASPTPLPGNTPLQEPLFASSGPSTVSGAVSSETPPPYKSDREVRKAISPIRKRISERLVAVRQQTAMLTTFNEVDMTNVLALRTANRERYMAVYGVSLGLMPFFVKGSVRALRAFPSVNASIDGNEFVYYNYFDIGVAIGSDKGLVVPVLRNADAMKCHEIDLAIREYKVKIDTFKISIAELTGGTFTISNGGIYGSMLSTPILNPPQSAVLGMHAIQDRPVVREGQMVIRPMMYLALSYDHRMIDGREAVGFLKMVKDYVENVDMSDVDG